MTIEQEEDPNEMMTTDKDVAKNADRQVVGNITQDEFTKIVKSSDVPVLITNKGNPINTDILNGKEDAIFALYGWKENGYEREINLVSNVKTMTSSDIYDGLKYSLNSKSNNYSPAKVQGTGSYIRTITEKKRVTKKMKWTYFDSSVIFKRRSSKVDVDGKKGSLWDVQVVDQTSTSSPEELNKAIVSIDANYGDGQKMVDWGPDTGKTTNKNITFTLSGGGIRGFGFKFGNSYKMTIRDHSSKHSSNGKWSVTNEVKIKKPHMRKLSLRPGVRLTNTKGSTCVGVKLSAYQFRPNAWGGTISTSTYHFAVPDR